MKTRVLTGALIGLIALVAIVQGGLVYFFLLLALALVALNEFYRLTRLYHPFALPGLIALIVMLSMAWFYGPLWLLWGAILGLLLSAVFGLATGAKPGVTARMAITLFGLLYIGFGFGALLMLRTIQMPEALQTSGRWIVLTVVFGAWAGDTMAYFIGRRFGSRPIAPNLSPNKTLEGLLGGALSTILLVAFLGIYSPLGIAYSAALGVVIAIVGPIGDLFESLIKRDVQIKDSGRGLPGHGGVLDRFDALLWAALAAYVLLTVAFGF